MNDKTFEIGEMCLVPMVGKSGMDFSYGIVIRRNPLKLRSNFYSVYVNRRIQEYENLFIAKLEELEDESFYTN
jgi:hypothetical protein